MTANGKKWSTLLFNPFFYIAGSQALFIGFAAILVTGFIGSISYTHFDGVLDTHTNSHFHAPLWWFLAEGFVDWLCLALVLLILGRIVSKTPFRTIDLVGTMTMARWPTFFISLITLSKGYQRFGDYLASQLNNLGNVEFKGADAAMFIAVLCILFPIICWTVFLMYKAYSVSCNVKGGRAIGTFIAGILIAEILSKAAFSELLKLL